MRILSVNLKGELFATTLCFASQAVIRLISSLVLTRILTPEAYGVITIVMSIAFVLEMLADIGLTIFIVRDKRAEEPRYLNTAWTLRLGRAVLNCAVLFFGAPLISTSIYHLPTLITPLRIFSLWFILGGLESMSFPLAIRHKTARIPMYADLGVSFVSTIFTIVYCEFYRDYWGILYGILLNRLLFTLVSYQFYKDFRPRLQIDRAVAREMFGTTKYTMPSGLLTLALSQFDKVVLLRLFDLRTVGLYGLAANIASPIESLILKISQMVLYPRCAHNFRSDEQTFVSKYYRENTKLYASIMVLPAAVGGAAPLIIDFLYPARYSSAGPILQALMLRAALISLSSPAEDMLIAAGESRVIILGGLTRVLWMIAASAAGYRLGGFTGFVYGFGSSAMAPLIYNLWLQKKKGMLMVRYELYKVVFLVAVAALAYVTSSALLPLLRAFRVGG